MQICSKATDRDTGNIMWNFNWCVILLMGNTSSTQMHTQTLNSFLPDFSKMTGETSQGVYACRCTCVCNIKRAIPVSPLQRPLHVSLLWFSRLSWMLILSSWALAESNMSRVGQLWLPEVLYVLGLAGKMLPFLETVFMGFSFSQASCLQQLQKSSKLKE